MMWPFFNSLPMFRGRTSNVKKILFCFITIVCPLGLNVLYALCYYWVNKCCCSLYELRLSLLFNRLINRRDGTLAYVSGSQRMRAIHNWCIAQNSLRKAGHQIIAQLFLQNVGRTRVAWAAYNSHNAFRSTHLQFSATFTAL